MNPTLKKGDRVTLLYMEHGDSVLPGESGVVTSVDNIFGDIQYGVNWDNGSRLALLSDTDSWVFEKKRIKEDEIKKMDVLFKNIDVFRFFKMGFFRRYLLAIREASFTNMVVAAPYLWMGKERIEHEFKYHDIHNEDAFEKVLSMANEAQANMINGVVNYLESEGIEEDMSTINKYLKRFATKIVENYMYM